MDNILSVNIPGPSTVSTSFVEVVDSVKNDNVVIHSPKSRVSSVAASPYKKNQLLHPSLFVSKESDPSRPTSLSDMSAITKKKTTSMSLPKHGQRLRKCLYQESVHFAHTNVNGLYEIVMSVPNASDPMARVTNAEKTKFKTIELKKTSPPRDRWNHLFLLFFVLACDSIGSIMITGPGMENVAHLGFGFIFTYTICWIVFGIPMLQLQHVFSQFLQGGPLRCFSLLHSRTRGIGMAFVALIVVRSSLQIRVIGESLRYLIGATQKPLPWHITPSLIKECRMQAGFHDACIEIPYCRDAFNNGTCYEHTLGRATAFYQSTVVGYTGNSTTELEMAVFVSSLAGGLFVVIILLGGIKFLGQIATFTVITTLFMLFCMVMVSITIPGGNRGALLFFQQLDLSLIWKTKTWLASCDLVLRTSTVIVGVHSVLPSYTRIGKNVPCLAWGICIISIISWLAMVIIVHSLEGASYIATERAALEAIYSSTILPTDENMLLIEHFVATKLASNEFVTYVRQRISETNGYETFFILLAWGTARFVGGAVLGILFYLCAFMIIGISLAGAAIALQSTICEISYFEHLAKWKSSAFVIIALYLVAFPTFFNYPIQMDNLNMTGHYLAHQIYFSMVHIGVPLTSLFFVLSVGYLLGSWRELSHIPCSRRCIHTVGCLIGGIAVLILLVADNLLVRRIGGLSAFTLFFIVVPLLIAFFQLKQPFFKYLRYLLYEDTNLTRETINDIISGDTHGSRLTLLWVISIKYVVPVSCQAVFIYSGSYWLRPFLPDAFEKRTNNTCDGIIFFITSSPILLFCAFPKLGNVFSPSKANSWKISDIHFKKRRHMFGFRRRRVLFWEEFYTPNSIWSSADVIRRRKISI